MYVPKPNTLRARICDALFHGPKSMLQITSMFCADQYKTVNSSVNTMISLGAIHAENGVYCLADALRAHYNGVDLPPEPPPANIVPPRTAPEFRPIQAKHLPGMTPLRPDAPPLRDISYCSGAFGETNVFHEVR